MSNEGGMAEVKRLLLGTWRGRFGLTVLGIALFLTLFGALIAPDDPNASSTDVLASPRGATRSGRPRTGPTSSRSSSSGRACRSSSASRRR